MIREILLILGALVFLPTTVYFIIADVKDVKSDFKEIGCPIILLVSMFIIMGALLLRTTYATETLYKDKRDLLSIKSETQNNIYGKITGNFLYIDGEIKTESSTYLQFYIKDENSKVSFVCIDLLSPKQKYELYIIDEGSPYVITRYKRKYQHVEMFNKIYNDDYEDSDFILEIYIPEDSIIFDNGE